MTEILSPKRLEWRDLLHKIYSAFVSEERQRMRHALRAWFKAGCVMRVPHEPKYPWVNEDDYYSNYMS